MKNYLAVLLLVVVLAGGWYLLSKKPATPSGISSATTATFYCAEKRTITASFSTDAAALTLSDGRTLTLAHAIAASGVRYEATTTGADIVFWNKGDDAYLTENGQTTYGDCIAAKVADSDAPGYRTYTDRSGTFTFAFPSEFSVTGAGMGMGPGWSVVATTSGQVLAKITADRTYQPGTNFADAWFSVGTSADPAAVASCEKNLSGNETTGTPVTIGGVRFTSFGFTGAGAGNFYDTTSYRTVRDNTCWAIEYTIHSGNIGNYPAGTVKEFDKKQVTADFEEIARSFRFLK